MRDWKLKKKKNKIRKKKRRKIIEKRKDEREKKEKSTLKGKHFQERCFVKRDLHTWQSLS